VAGGGGWSGAAAADVAYLMGVWQWSARGGVGRARLSQAHRASAGGALGAAPPDVGSQVFATQGEVFLLGFLTVGDGDVARTGCVCKREPSCGRHCLALDRQQPPPCGDPGKSCVTVRNYIGTNSNLTSVLAPPACVPSLAPPIDHDPCIQAMCRGACFRLCCTRQ